MNFESANEYFRGLIKSELTPSISICCVDKTGETYRFAAGTEKPGDDTKKVSDDTLFNIASVSKTVTSLIMLKLVENGTVSLTDKVKKYIPQYTFDDVLICHLLTHTAGYYEYEALPRPKTEADRAAYFQSIYGVHERKYAVGEKAAYWTYDYSIIADLAERATGCGLGELAKEWLFEPLDMKHTSFYQYDLNSCGLVRPWYEETQSFLTDICTPVITGDAGIWTAAHDFSHIARMILCEGVYEGRRILSKASIRFLLNEKAGKFKNSAGFWIRGEQDTFGCFGELASSRAAGHTGMSGCMLFVDPAYDLGAVILSNSIKLHTDWNNYKKICNVLVALKTD